MQRYRLAELRTAPSPLFIYWDESLPSDLEEWIQPLDRWLLIAYACPAIAHVDMVTVTIEPGDCVLFPPSCRGRHSLRREEFPHYRILFGLPGGGERVALPIHARPYEGWQAQLERAHQSMAMVDRHSQAFVWNLLWQISVPESQYRSRAELHEAEDWIRRHLADSFHVQDVAAAVGLSERTLTRLFRAEHQASVAQFVRDFRVREAIRLLTTTDLPLKQIALRIGVESSQGFYSLIRDSVGVSPTEIRKRAES